MAVIVVKNMNIDLVTPLVAAILRITGFKSSIYDAVVSCVKGFAMNGRSVPTTPDRYFHSLPFRLRSLLTSVDDLCKLSPKLAADICSRVVSLTRICIKSYPVDDYDDRSQPPLIKVLPPLPLPLYLTPTE